MPRMFAAVPLLVLALGLPGTALAGPPEGVSGKMVLDKVADGLRQYRQAKGLAVRKRLLKKLAPTHDPRVAVTLGEALADSEIDEFAAWELRSHYRTTRGSLPINKDELMTESTTWWHANGADLRRRAKQLPQ
jgi:hypothetical protein